MPLANSTVGPTMTRRQRLVAWLLGRDVFISYAREDGSDYAVALAEGLARRGLTCWLDQWGSHPSRELPEKLKRDLRRSATFALVGTHCAIASKAVKDELDIFLQTRKYVIPISVDDTHRQPQWFAAIGGLSLSLERGAEEGSVGTRAPSTAVLDRIANAVGYWRQSRRVLVVFAAFVVLSIALAAGALWASWNAEQHRVEAENGARAAAAAEQRASENAASAQANAASAVRAQQLAQAEAANAVKARKVAEEQRALARQQAREARLQAAASRALDLTTRAENLLPTGVALALETHARLPAAQRATSEDVIRNGLRLLAPRVAVARVALGRASSFALRGTQVVAIEGDREIVLRDGESAAALGRWPIEGATLPARPCQRGAMWVAGRTLHFFDIDRGAGDRIELPFAARQLAIASQSCSAAVFGDGGALIVAPGPLRIERSVAIEGPPATVSVPALSTDGSRLALVATAQASSSSAPAASAPASARIEILDTATGRRVAGFAGAATAIALDASGRRLAASSVAMPAVVLYDVASGSSIPIAERELVRALSFDESGRHLTVGGNDGVVRVFASSDGAERARVVPRPGQVVLAAALSGTRLAVLRSDTTAAVGAAADAELSFWDLSRRLGAAGARSNRAPMTTLARGGRFAARVDEQDALTVVDTLSMAPAWSRPPGSAPCQRTPSLSADGSLFACISRAPRGVLVAMRDEAGPARSITPDDVSELAVADDGTAVAGISGTLVRVWRRSGRSFGDSASARSPNRGIVGLALSPDGKRLVTLNIDRPGLPFEARLWRIDGGLAEWPDFAHLAGPERPAFSLDGRSVATTGGTSVMLWKAMPVSGRQKARTFVVDGEASEVAIGSSIVAVVSRNRRAGAGADRLSVRSLADPTHELTGTALPEAAVQVTVSAADDEVVLMTAAGSIERFALGGDALRRNACALLPSPLSAAQWAEYLLPEPYAPVCGNGRAPR